MKILLSPAKSLDFTRECAVPETSQPQFIKEAGYLVQKLQSFSAKKLAKLMSLSPQLAELNFNRFQNWVEPKLLSNEVKPAVTVFTGEVYRGLDILNFSTSDFRFAQKKLFILSGLYGILKPLDLMFPYRLEMGTKWEITPKNKNLYAFWGSKIANMINESTNENETVLNLASNEYYKVVDQKILKRRVITPVFKELKGNQLKVIMMYAKHARGAMAKEIIQNRIENVNELKHYGVDGYRYDEKISTENEWVFVR